jgi:2-oxoglutarate ferredoxin oxidoreductase subunit beta
MTYSEQPHGIEMSEMHPQDEMLRPARLPLLWCPGCGLGIVTNCLVGSIMRSGVPVDKHVVVIGPGCALPLLSYLNLRTERATKGGAVPFAIGLKTADPGLEVTLVVCDSDLFNTGDSHLVHAARQNVDLNVFCVNNFNYGMTGGQLDSDKHERDQRNSVPFRTTVSSNLSYAVASAGAAFVSRWTTIHVRQLLKAMQHAFQVHGLAFLEIVAPCPPGFSQSGEFEDGYAIMEYFRTCSRVYDGADLTKISLSTHCSRQLRGRTKARVP